MNAKSAIFITWSLTSSFISLLRSTMLTFHNSQHLTQRYPHIMQSYVLPDNRKQWRERDQKKKCNNSICTNPKPPWSITYKHSTYRTEVQKVIEFFVAGSRSKVGRCVHHHRTLRLSLLNTSKSESNKILPKLYLLFHHDSFGSFLQWLLQKVEKQGSKQPTLVSKFVQHCIFCPLKILTQPQSWLAWGQQTGAN